MIYAGVPCDEWTGSRTRDGYGRVGHQGLTHRLAWIAVHGPIPPETPKVLHHCDNPPCREVAHLFLGTQKVNMADAAEKGRIWAQKLAKCPAGHPYDFVDCNGKRRCLRCSNQQSRESKARQRDRLRPDRVRKPRKVVGTV